MALSTGQKLGPYEIISPLGAGGMGEVYRARDPRLDRDVAIKVLPEALASDEELLRRFHQEARVMASLSHPHVVQVFEAGEFEGLSYLVMELLEGENLRDRLGGKALSAKRAVEITCAVAEGLGAVHAKGIIHRDLKPENVFMTRDGRIKVLDFGLAKRPQVRRSESDRSDAPTQEFADSHLETETGRVMGTVGYMSPEQVRGEPLDARSDLFSLGVILWEMITGERPFRGASAVETMNAILKEDPPPFDLQLGVPPVLAKVIHTCLAKEPEQRFHSAHDLAFALGTFSNTSFSSGGRNHSLMPLPTGRGWLQATASLGLVLLVSAGAWWTGRHRPAPPFPTFKRVTFTKGDIEGAFFIPGSRELVFAPSWHGSGPEIHTLNPEALEARPSTILVNRLLGIARNQDVLVQNRDGIELVSLGGGGRRGLPSAVEIATFDANGDLAAVLKDEQGWAVQWPLGKERHRSARAIDELFASKEAKRIAFTQVVLGPKGLDRELYVMEGDTPARKVATIDSMENHYWAWGPKGREIWATVYKFGFDQSEIRAYGLDGSIRILWRGAGHLHLKDVDPEGRVLVDLCTRRMELIAQAPGRTEEEDLSWFDGSALISLSRDGRKVYFQDRWKGGMAGGGYVRATTGGPATRLVEGNFSCIPSLSADGSYVLLTLEGAANQLVRVPTAGGENQGITTEVEGHPMRIWNAGTQVLVAAAGPGMEMQGTKVGAVLPWKNGAKALFTVPGEVDPMVLIDNPISPDASSFLWIRTDRPQPRLEIHSLKDGRILQTLPLGEKEETRVAGWLPDGRGILLATFGYREISLFRLDISSGSRSKVRDLRISDPNGAAGLMNFLVAGDGKSYAYTLLRNYSELYLVEGLQ